jgi:hypothetical protein
MQVITPGRDDRKPRVVFLHEVPQEGIAGLHGVDARKPQFFDQPIVIECRQECWLRGT